MKAGTRSDAAKRLLESSNMGITQIAHACGFDEPNKFYVFFKRETGKSPTEWRNR
ncbi:MAG: AraC family transcriptional regulator [Akkermansiaceae bacterium]|nr:AraC family transcriptional regulator [Akkermansiaceae bacterium]MCF7732659.1 AraC family transcriptional regulator [Akkermansiaceae bacterium]